MGDLSAPPTPGAGRTEPISQRPSDSSSGHLVFDEKQRDTKQDAALSQQPLAIAQHAFSSQPDMAAAPPPYGQPQGPYDMTTMAGNLPAVTYQPGQYPQGVQRYNHATSPPMLQQMPHMAPYGGPAPMHMANQGYYVHQPQMPQYYVAGPVSPTQAQPTMHARQNVAYYPNQMIMNHAQSAFYYPQANQYPGQPQNVATNMMPGQYMVGSPTGPDARMLRPTMDGPGTLSQDHRQDQGMVSDSTHQGILIKASPDESGSRQKAVRGPPRKPRQSGHAIWIGNLPPQTDLMSLVHHVCKETAGLESLFLISKSNCAFANFKDEKTCVAAQQELHDSKFQSARLVSRLRKNTVEGATGLTAPTGPAASATSGTAPGDLAQDSAPSETESLSPVASQLVKPRVNPAGEGRAQPDKFFIMKSLTMEDLELSVRTGIWATQPHNEEVLNNAFKTVDNVYLIFSANKSGEYFGYARMASQINEDPSAAIEFAPKTQATTTLDLTKAIPTEATEYTPKGRIIDDSTRGTIFWESGGEDSESGSDNESEISSDRGAGTEEDTKTWGKPFRLEWLSTSRLPFYRTRGLRNPWNSNREVKIARDGTELEPSVGCRLIGLFNRVQSPVLVSQVMCPPLAMMHDFPPMLPYS
ncbi:Uncharacterized protein TPAR_08531 [Tolypocladium paradoxum]|uniref:YTH domain-containing protein n=1 Tax=Tolypocladium paradoxum TaxID=94208 RepID=A0A2S4KM56_9HYPO|nr:Uncharacterized protein TPAR_08531 [Tolypocladium paradoxum]